ncbi:MAG: outer membrane beta-barrel protein [Bacteroidota bacterium]
MKKITIFLFVAVLSTFAAKAQEFKKFRVGIGGGYASASGKGAKGGVLLYVEPGYRVMDQLIVNLRMESAIIARGSATDTEADLDVAGLGSYTLNAQYYFNNNDFRPFAGAGFGLFSLAAVSIDAGQGGGSVTAAAASNEFGFYPRVGFDYKHFTLSIDYNVVPETNDIKNSYIGIRIGGFFGGGRK